MQKGFLQHYGVFHIPTNRWLRTNAGIFWTTSKGVAKAQLDSMELELLQYGEFSVRQFNDKINIDNGSKRHNSSHNRNPNR